VQYLDPKPAEANAAPAAQAGSEPAHTGEAAEGK